MFCTSRVVIPKDAAVSLVLTGAATLTTTRRQRFVLPCHASCTTPIIIMQQTDRNAGRVRCRQIL